MTDSTVSKARTMTDTESAEVSSALAVLLSVLGSAEFSEEGTTLPSELAKLDSKAEEALLVRTLRCLQAKRTEGEREMLKTIHTGVSTACHTARVARIEAYREIAALSPTVKMLLGEKAAPPTGTSVAVSSVMSHFPAGTTAEQAVVLLHRCGFKLVQGAAKQSEKRINVNIGADALAKYLAEKQATEAAADLGAEGDTQG